VQDSDDSKDKIGMIDLDKFESEANESQTVDLFVHDEDEQHNIFEENKNQIGR